MIAIGATLVFVIAIIIGTDLRNIHKEQTDSRDIPVSIESITDIERGTAQKVNSEIVEPDSIPESVTVMTGTSGEITNTELATSLTKHGYLKIIAEPWAEVYLNDKRIGLTPINEKELIPGTYDVTFKHEFYPNLNKRIEVAALEVKTLKVVFTEELSRLYISALPWAYLYIDMDSLGLLPRIDPIWLSPGEHQILLTHPEMTDWEDRMLFESGELVNLKVDLSNGMKIATSN